MNLYPWKMLLILCLIQFWSFRNLKNLIFLHYLSWRDWRILTLSLIYIVLMSFSGMLKKEAASRRFYQWHSKVSNAFFLTGIIFRSGVRGRIASLQMQKMFEKVTFLLNLHMLSPNYLFQECGSMTYDLPCPQT